MSGFIFSIVDSYIGHRYVFDGAVQSAVLDRVMRLLEASGSASEPSSDEALMAHDQATSILRDISSGKITLNLLRKVPLNDV